MGLDSVELVMTIEDKFGISIPDNEYQNISTEQQMADAIFERLTLAPNQKNDIFIYVGDLKSDWSKFQDRIGLKIPQLIYPLNKEVHF